MLKDIQANPWILIVAVSAGIVLYFGLIGMFLRLMLALPDASIGAGGRVFTVYKASAGSAMRLVGAALLLGVVSVFAFTVFVLVLGAAVGMIFGAGASTSPVGIGVGAVIGFAVYLYFLMAQITMLSVAYREIIGLPGAPAAQEV